MIEQDPQTPDKPLPTEDAANTALEGALEMFRPLAALIALPANSNPPPPSRRAPAAEPADFYINVFQDNRRGWMNSEAGFAELSECYESILEGQRAASYRYTLHVRLRDGERLAGIDDFEADARAWGQREQADESFLYANSAGRRL